MTDDYSNNIKTTGALTVGGSASGNFDYAYDDDWYQIKLEAGKTYLLSTQSPAKGAGGLSDVSHAMLYLYDAQGTALDLDYGGDTGQGPILQFTPASTGNYFLSSTMSSFDYSRPTDMLGSYTVKAVLQPPDDIPSTVSTTRVLEVGIPATATFEVAGDRDWFKFHAEVGQHITFPVVNNPDGSSPVFDVEVYDPSGSTIVPWAYPFEPLVSGDYYVSVEGRAVGAYTFTAALKVDDYSQNNTTSGSLGVGATVSGKLDYSFDVDRFKMTMTAGVSYLVDVSSALSGVGVLRLSAVDSAGHQLASGSTQRYGDTAVYATVTATVTGDYYLDVSQEYQLPFRAPNYTLTSVSAMVDDYGGTTASAGKITVGVPAAGLFQSFQDVDMVAVDLTAGTTYQFSIAAANTGASQPVGVYLALSGPDGAAIYSSAYGPRNDYSYTPTTSGSYYLSASTSSLLQQAYTLSATLAPDDYGASVATAGKLAVGGVIKGTLEAGGGDRDLFAVALSAGNTYWFTLGGSREQQGTLSGATQVRILDQNGNVLANTKDLNFSGGTTPILPFVPAASGTYYAEVSVNDRSTGTYQLQAQIGQRDDYGNDIDHAAAISAGAVKTGVIELASDHDMFQLAVTAGATYSLMLATPGNPNQSYGLQLTATDGSQHALALRSDQGQYFFDAVATGSYYVTVSGSDSLSPAPKLGYALTATSYGIDDFLTGIKTAGQLAVNAKVAGAFSYPDDVDWVRVHLDAGRSYVFEMQGAKTGGGTLDTQRASLALYDGAGSQQLTIQSDNYVEPRVRFVAKTSGDYYLVASSHSSLNASYTLAATQTSGDLTPPLLTSVTPQPGASGVGLGDKVIMTFSEPIMAAQGSESAGITLKDANGVALGLYNSNQSIFSVIGNTLVLDPYQNLQPGMQYTLQFSSNSITDLAGNPYGAASLTFSTVATVAAASEGNDLLIGKSNGATINGGAGIDTVYYADPSPNSFPSHNSAGQWVIRMYAVLNSAPDILVGIERLIFPTHAQALDIDGNGGQAYRLYQAAFNRTPDLSGLGFWMAALDGGTSLHDVAVGFVQSAEFIKLYGANTSDAAFVALLYNNVLHRVPDAPGAAYWQNGLQQGASRADILINFSESTENQLALIGQIGNGFAYTPYH